MSLKFILLISLTVALVVLHASAEPKKSTKTRVTGGFRGRSIKAAKLTRSLQKAFKASKVVPDILAKAPTHSIIVKYAGVKVKRGSIVDSPIYVNEPTLKWVSKMGKLYTLIMLDADALCPKSPNARSAVRWMVSNIKGNRISQGKINAAYSPPVSRPEKHRYVFLVFQQRGKADFGDYSTSDKSLNFDLRNFVKTNCLTDRLIAGTYFRTLDTSAPATPACEPTEVIPSEASPTEEPETDDDEPVVPEDEVPTPEEGVEQPEEGESGESGESEEEEDEEVEETDPLISSPVATP